MSHRPRWTPLHAQLHRTLRQRELLERHQRVLIAVSGGQDSLCLGRLLLDLQPKWGWQLAIAHCDHRWFRDEGLAPRVQQLAREWVLPFYLQVAPEVRETEAAARQWRYRALLEVARSQGYPVIATGHTQSDRAETLLYNLVRGAGADGLGALRWKRPLAEQVWLVRPLLAVSRAETGEFCQQQHLSVWDDPYNQELKYARNRIRQELLPYLQTHFNPRVERTLAQTAELLRADVDYLETAARQLREQATLCGNTEAENRESIPVGQTSRRLNRLVLRQAAFALQRRALRQFLQQSQATAPSFEQIEEVTALIDAPNRSRTSTFPGGITAVVSGDWIVLQDS